MRCCMLLLPAAEAEEEGYGDEAGPSGSGAAGTTLQLDEEDEALFDDGGWHSCGLWVQCLSM